MRSPHYTTAGIILLAFALTALLVRLADVVVNRLLGRLDVVSAENQTAIRDRARRLIRALTLMAYGVATAASISFALSRFGIAERSTRYRSSSVGTRRGGFFEPSQR